MVEQEALQETSGTQVGSAQTPSPCHSQAPSQGKPSSEEASKKRKPSRLTSNAWAHFKKEGDEAMGNYCGKTYTYKCNGSNFGTTNMRKHLKICAKNPNREFDKKQKTLVLGNQSESDRVLLELGKFNQDQCDTELAKMLVVDDLSVDFILSPRFRRFMSVTQPQFTMPSYATMTRKIVDLFRGEKEKLKSLLSLNNQMFSLTVDTWTTIQKVNYLCISAVFIDEGWKFHRKILSFGLINDHKGETIVKALEKCVKDWGIVRICTVTVNNASVDNTALAYLVRSLGDWNGSTMLKGDYMQIRCCAHILNSIVCDKMKEFDVSIAKIRACCQYVRSSPLGFDTFDWYVHDAKLPTNRLLALDVSDRWDSTFVMLETAEKFEKAFTFLKYNDPSFVPTVDSDGGPPNSDDWKRVRVLVKFLKVFYDAALAFSRSLHVTSNNFFHKLCNILNKLNKCMENDDLDVKKMTTSMKNIVNKYWDINGNLNYLLLVAVFLDPRFKLEYIDFCLSQMYRSDKCAEILTKFKDLINDLFAQYAALYPLPLDSGNASGLSPLEDEFRLNMIKQGKLKRNELERYMEDDIEDDYHGFDILTWWRGNTKKYYILSRMARDILAIPVSTVSSGFAFSTQGHVLDPYHSSLSPAIVEAFICTQSWLRSDSVSQADWVINAEKVYTTDDWLLEV